MRSLSTFVVAALVILLLTADASACGRRALFGGRHVIATRIVERERHGILFGRARVGCPSTTVVTPAIPVPMPPAKPKAEEELSVFVPTQYASVDSSYDGLDEVNAKRAARGLRPFIRDTALFQAAAAVAQFRAQHRLFGHTSNDYAFLPVGSSCSSFGCAAYPPDHGWMSCCTYDNYTYAGAAWVMGPDGNRYMHLAVR